MGEAIVSRGSCVFYSWFVSCRGEAIITCGSCVGSGGEKFAGIVGDESAANVEAVNDVAFLMHSVSFKAALLVAVIAR